MAQVSAGAPPTPAAADSHAPKPAVPKMSFASVAALAAPPKPNKPAASANQSENRPLIPSEHVSTKPGEPVAPHAPLRALQESVAKLNLANTPGPVIASADTDIEQPQPLPPVLTNDDEKTHLSFISNPTVSTDVRSVASGTAFMDEKESIRPDESASVKGVDESDSASGQGSGGTQSQAPSEAGKDVFRDQFQEISSARRALPLATSLVSRIPEDTNRTAIASTLEYQPQGPDEKLLDALDNPKDRIFLLQLEQQVLAFIANPKEPVLSLPPQNSFCRLLAHRLADYYGLSHTADVQSTVVRLGKTEGTRLPPSLKDISAPRTPESGVPQPQKALKIMRRKAASYGKDMAGGDDTADSSAIQSQAGSDTGASGLDLQRSPSKALKNMTREEKEAHYQAARDRIFGETEEAKPAIHETSTAASRTSSATGGKTKKNKSRPKNDDFETRTMFMMGQQQQQAFGYNDRQHQQMYPGYPAMPGMPGQPMAGPYSDATMAAQTGFHNQSALGQHAQMPPQQIAMSPMQGYPQQNYPQQPVYNGNYGYGSQGQPMGPMPMQQQQHFYPGPDQAQAFNNMGGPMMNPNQQGYAPNYQGWNQNMATPYGGQDQSGYFQQQQGPGIMYPGPQKPMDGATPPGVRYNTGEHAIGNPSFPSQQNQQQPQWHQWAGQAQQYPQYSNTPPPWQSIQPSMQGSPMPPNAMMQHPQANPYQQQANNNGKPAGKKGGNRVNKASELGKYDTSSLPPKPPAPLD